MPRYQVTITYTTIVDDAKNEGYAESYALQEVGADPYEYSHIEIEEVNTPKCCGLRTHTYEDHMRLDVIEDQEGYYNENDTSLDSAYRLWYEKYQPQLDRINYTYLKEYIRILESLEDCSEEYKSQQEKILNALKERLGVTEGE